MPISTVSRIPKPGGWREASGDQGKAVPMLLMGYVFLKNNGFRRQLDTIDTLFVGGDTRYGLGKIGRVQWRKLPDDATVFGRHFHLHNADPEIKSDVVRGHAPAEDSPQLHGMKALLGGWEHGAPWRGALAWSPGSFLEQAAAWSIDTYGYWKDRTITAQTPEPK